MGVDEELEKSDTAFDISKVEPSIFLGEPDPSGVNGSFTCSKLWNIGWSPCLSMNTRPCWMNSKKQSNKRLTRGRFGNSLKDPSGK